MSKNLRKTGIQEGTILAIPAYSVSGYLIGIVGRQSDSRSLSGELLLYLFAPIFSEIPNADAAQDLTPEEAVDVVRTGTLRVHDGTWPVLGNKAEFDRNRWPIPPFGKIDALCSDRGFIVVYKEDDLESAVIEREASAETANRYYEYILRGVDNASYKATKLIHSDQNS